MLGGEQSVEVAGRRCPGLQRGFLVNLGRLHLSYVGTNQHHPKLHSSISSREDVGMTSMTYGKSAGARGNSPNHLYETGAFLSFLEEVL